MAVTAVTSAAPNNQRKPRRERAGGSGALTGRGAVAVSVMSPTSPQPTSGQPPVML
ncbi:hypothetical protein GCM10027521_32160 [Amycolatopsis cihanbeyliensis]